MSLIFFMILSESPVNRKLNDHDISSIADLFLLQGGHEKYYICVFGT